ncbi:SpoIIE family protein phosphatase [Streptomyces sp. BI20]|uniref:SpoIIE family protein phosphatase n=1 Tax=Streptomyces sp. BI20 TaxID=3403460 RepID=UPI003C755F43
MSTPAFEELAAAVADLGAEVADLHADRARRRLLDLATGVLVDQLGLDPGEAGDHLRDLAVSTGLGAADLAADIVNAAAGGPVTTPAPESRRIRRAQAAVHTADTAGEAARSLLEGGLRRLGVRALMLWRRTDSDCLELVGHAGVGPTEAVHWQWVPPDTPLHRPLWEHTSWWGQDPWLPGGSEEAPTTDRTAHAVPATLEPGTGTGTGPVPATGAAGPAGPDVRAGEGPVSGFPDAPADPALRALFPLRRRGAVVGVALAVWAADAEGRAAARDPAVRRTAELLCEPSGALLEVPEPLGLRDRETALLDLCDRPGALLDEDGRVGYLNPAGHTALSGVHRPVGRPAAEVFPYAWPRLAAAVRRVGAQYLGQVDDLDEVRVLPLARGRAAVVWNAPGDPGQAPLRALSRLERIGWFREDTRSGHTAWSEPSRLLFGLAPQDPAVPLAHLAEHVHPDDAEAVDALVNALIGRHEGGLAVVRAVRPDGTVRHVRIAAEPLLDGSVLTGVIGLHQDVSDRRRTELALSAAQEDAVQRARFTLRLQQVIMPESVPAPPAALGLEVAGRYRPAAQDYRVGGDWYDVTRLPDGRCLFVVGDIAGHGLDASTGMVALRNALRGLAVTGSPPGRLLGWLNDLTLATPGRPTATAVCALYTPWTRTLCWSVAGHPPPLLLRAGRARFLKAPQNIILGALPGAGYEEAECELRPEDVLLFYTDGFVERRHVSLDDSLTALRHAVEHLPPHGLQARADTLMSQVIGDTDDDTSLLLVRVTTPDPL